MFQNAIFSPAVKTGIFGGTFGGLLRIKLLVGPPSCQSNESSRSSGLKSAGGALHAKQIRLAADQRKEKHILRDFLHQPKLHLHFLVSKIWPRNSLGLARRIQLFNIWWIVRNFVPFLVSENFDMRQDPLLRVDTFVQGPVVQGPLCPRDGCPRTTLSKRH